MNVSEIGVRANGNGAAKLDAAVLDAYGKYTLPQILGEQAKRLGAGHLAIREKAYGIWQTVNWEEYFGYVRRVALGLIGLGVRRRDNVAIVTNNHPEWLYSELGAQAAGCVTVNLFTSSIADELAEALKRFQPAVVRQPGPWPRLAGPDGHEMALIRTYQQTRALLEPVGLKLAKLAQDERRAWWLTFDNGLEVYLGREQFERRLRRLIRVYPLILSAQIDRIAVVDMRYVNGFAVRWKVGPPAPAAG